MKKMKNPLNHRIFREIRGDFRKYLVIFLFLTLTIGFVSGMDVANDSMLTAAENSVEKYNREDGKFTLQKKASQELISAIEKGDQDDVRAYVQEEAEKKAKEAVEKDGRAQIEKEVRSRIQQQVKDAGLTGDMAKTAEEEAWDGSREEVEEVVEKAGKEAVEEARKKAAEEYDKRTRKDTEDSSFSVTPVTLYENFSKDMTERFHKDTEQNVTLRVYQNRTEIDRPCLMEGKLPEKEGEIAIDRMHADNRKIQVGDVIQAGGQNLTVTGLISLPDYTTLFEKSTDTMFDAITFDVGLVTRETFEKLSGKTSWTYSWKYQTKPADESAENDDSNSFTRVVSTNAITHDNSLTDYIPAYRNQAIRFAVDDFGGDKAMGTVFLYILVVVIAFIFAITISSTIQNEASVIGTLRASGYTREELLRHYMTMPLIVTLISAIAGNALGYTFFKDLVVSMYYNSYSLPTYQTIPNGEAFFSTTVIPFLLMLVVNYFVIRKKLSISPIRFLRHDLGRRGKKKAAKLPNLSFFKRFRLRILIQNLPNYFVLFVGILFSAVLIVFCIGMPATLKHYQKNVVKEMFASYQYMLYANLDEEGNLIATSNPDAEKIGMTSLVTTEGARTGEEISIYGISDHSQYITLPAGELSGNEVYISRAYADKFGLKKGDTLHLKGKYSSDTYDFKVKGIYEYTGGLVAFLPISSYNRIFDKDTDFFSGYLSDSEITDIDPDLIATTITETDIVKIATQLDHSMGSYMQIMQVVCVVLAAGLIYLLSKVIIERNEHAISMTKILGYTNREIASLYILSTFWVVLLSTVIAVLLSNFLVGKLFLMYMNMLDGWLPYYYPVSGLAEAFVSILVAYAVVTLVDYRRIRRIPMEDALKNVE